MHTPASWQRTSLIQFSHCSYCGVAYPDPLAAWPRTCAGCTEVSWRNPLPVAIVLLPVRVAPDRVGLVVIRRDIEPARGELALPGGFIEVGETWQDAAIRELREETGLLAKASEVRLFTTVSTAWHLNVFALLAARDADDLPPSIATDEAAEWLVLQQAMPLAFPSHTAAVQEFFATI
jgi:ADP-ribose pyrophosphatase YjhB (NUDIX family)